MNYTEGISFIKELSKLHSNSGLGNYKLFIIMSNLKLEFPGYKNNGDYKLLYKQNDNWVPFSHSDIVSYIYKTTTPENALNIINSLDCIYQNGIMCDNDFFSHEIKNFLFWLTLQEDLNYPMPRYQGRKLPFQRFYEAVLAKLGFYELQYILGRTNNHNGGLPPLLQAP